MEEPRSFECEVAGKQLIIETGRFAEQANAAVTVRYGETVVLVTVCVSPQPREGVDFLPLTIDYEERLYAAGKIPGGFIRREGRPSQEATLAMRMTDRPLRPLLPKKWRREIQIIITVLSADLENAPDLLGLIGASTVLSMSEVPFAGPVSAVRVGYIDGELVLNPTMPQMESSEIDLIVASTRDSVVMVEAGAEQVSEDLVLRGIELGHEANQAILKLQQEIAEAVGRPKSEVESDELSPAIIDAVGKIADGRLPDVLSIIEKGPRDEGLAAIKAELVEQLGETYPVADLDKALDQMIRKVIRANILEKKQRISGRQVTEVRPLSCAVGLLPRTHGSGMFHRGQTQVMTITTLGSTRKEQQLDGLGIEETKRFIHHYNFTPYSTGETKRVGSPGRREIGHGALAERSLQPVLPKDEDFPYTIRLVSEVLSSAGSTSMASVCASSLSLMDAGIPIERAVAGIAMGLVTADDGSYVILTDIEGIEDNYGDMDWKVAGTSEGITGMQMDTKIKGLSMDIVKATLAQAKEARAFILDKMSQTISESRSELSDYAPRMYKLTVPTEKIGAVIGPGGKTIRSITEATKTTVDIDNDGTVLIGSANAADAAKAIEMVRGLTREAEIGDIYTGKVSRILNFGAMVEILPGKEGLVHISELADYRVGSVEDIVKIGDEIMVKVVDIDNLGRVNLSRKAVLEKTSETSGAQGSDSPAPQRRPYPRRDSRPSQRPRSQQDRRRS